MGHLINSNSIRIGWSRSWSDSWFVTSAYYPEFLHLILRIKFLLSYLLATKTFERNGLFYGHFTISNQYNYFFINIYFYDGFVEKWVNAFFTNYKKALKNAKREKDYRELSRGIADFPGWRILQLLNWIHKFKIWRLSTERIQFLLKSMQFVEWRRFARLIHTYPFKRSGRWIAIRIFFFFNIIRHIRKAILTNHLKPIVSTRSLFSRFIYMLAWSVWNKGLFNHFRAYFTFMLSFLNESNQFKLSFYALNTFTINAKFLTRYLAKKLKSGYTIFQLLQPIKRNLKSIIKLSNFPFTADIPDYYVNRLKWKNFKTLKIGALKMLLFFLCVPMIVHV